MTVAALVAGNCVLLKPAETSSVIIAKLTEILIEAGIPQGVFQYVPGKGSTVGAHLVKHPLTNMITFTGSQEVGCRIYADAAILQPGQKHLKRVVAEMVAKTPLLLMKVPIWTRQCRESFSLRLGIAVRNVLPARG